jgi:hypothetical protein
MGVERASKAQFSNYLAGFKQENSHLTQVEVDKMLTQT